MLREIVSCAAVAVVLGGCGTHPDEKVDPELQALKAWRTEQTEQECPDVPQDAAAKELVRAGQEGTTKVDVHGDDDPYNRRTRVLEHLWSRPNPKGSGTVVTAVRDSGEAGLNEADHSRQRAVWLVLDGAIYPLNIAASQAFGKLLSGLPSDVAAEAGLEEHVIDTKDALGIEEFITYRWHGSEDPLPTCGE